MPAAAIAPIIGGGLGAAGSLGSGKKGKNAQNQADKIAQAQLGLQQQQFGLTKQQYGLGNAALAPASNYWQNLLKGGQAAVQATGPYASAIGQNAEGSRNAISALTPRGGEQNLALAQNYNQAGNNIARLYAGMQPLAAQSLQGVGQTYLGSGAQVNPYSNIGGALQNYLGQQAIAGQGAQGYGSLIYNALNKLQSRGGGGGGGTGGKGGGTPPFVPYNVDYGSLSLGS